MDQIHYAVDIKTKAHRTLEDHERLKAGERLVVGDADGWIRHDGKGCPLPLDQPVECKDKHDGAVMKFSAAGSAIGWFKAFKQYRPLLNRPEQPKQWRGPEPGERARTSGGDCIVLAIDIERGKVSVQWHDGELGVVNVECIKSPTTDRERWIAAAEHAIENSTGEPANSTHLGLLFDTGLARLPEYV